MAGAIGKYAANKMLRKQMAQYQNKKVGGDTDPYFAMIDDPKRPGKQKKVKKQVPAYIPEHDATILAKMRRRSYRLDMALFEFAGTRFGWSSVIGIIPAAGDAVDALLALMLVWRCTKVTGGLPMTILILMLINVGVDFGIGLIPILGDIADAYWKANTKNVRLLEQHLDAKYKPAELKKKQPKNYPPATAFEDFDDEEDERRQLVNHAGGANNGVARPAPAVQKDGRQKKMGGWFGGRGASRREPDLEQGAGYARPPVTQAQETGTLYSDRR